MIRFSSFDRASKKILCFMVRRFGSVIFQTVAMPSYDLLHLAAVANIFDNFGNDKLVFTGVGIVLTSCWLVRCRCFTVLKSE